MKVLNVVPSISIALPIIMILGHAALVHAAPTPAKERKVKITVFEEKERSVEEEGPGFKMEQRLRQLTRQSDEKLDEAIETLKELIRAVPDDDPDKPNFYLALADAYWERSESFFEKAYAEKLESSLYKAEKANRQAEADALRAKQDALLDQQQEWRKKTVDVYKTVVEKFHAHEKNAQVLYSMGLFQTLTGDREGGFDTYKQLLKAHPKSLYAPDCLVNMGEYFFDDNDFETALLFYDRVRNGFPGAVVHSFAIYKGAWCHYNMGNFKPALSGFLDVIREGRSSKDKTKKGRIELHQEAQKDLVRAYASAGDPKKAIAFFQDVVPDLAFELALGLADHYKNQGKFKESIQLYYRLIEANPSTYKVLRYQRRIVNAVYHQGKRKRTVKEVETMLKLYQLIGPNAPPDWLKEEKTEVESELRIIATTWHTDAEKAGDDEQMKLAASLYRDYLRLFPDGEHVYAITMNYAGVLKSLNRYEEAALLFEKVIELRPDGEFAGDAAYFSILNFARRLDQKEQTIKSETGSGLLEPEEFPEVEQKMLAAFKRYLRLANPGDPEIPGAIFRTAVLYYDFNHFDKAIPLLEQLVSNHSDAPSAPGAARLLLSSLHHTQDFEKQTEWALKLANTSMATGDFRKIVTGIRDREEFNKCFRHKKAKNYLDAALCFQNYTRAYPEANDLDQAWFNAAVLFERAKQFLDALNALETLLEEHARSPMAAGALYQRGEIFRKLGFYKSASESYEIFVRKHPKHEKATSALERASRFRMGLGNYNEALRNFKKYRAMAEPSERGRIDFAAGQILENQKKWSAVEKHYRRFLKTYNKDDENLHRNINWLLGANLKIGIALWNRKKHKNALPFFSQVVTDYDASPGSYSAIALGFVAEALFMLGEQKLRLAKAIKFTGRNLQSVFEKKVEAIKEAREIFKEVIKLRQPNWVIAGLNRAGIAYEELAQAIGASPRPKIKDEFDREAYEDAVLEKVEQSNQRAARQYNECLKEASRMQWFNEYSEQATKRLATIDYSFRFLKEYRTKPTHYRSNESKPWFRFDRPLVIHHSTTPPRSGDLKSPSGDSTPEHAGGNP